jgi:hypothetical protein
MISPRARLAPSRLTKEGEAPTMTKHTYDKAITALVVVDPYNDFISEGGKIWDRIRTSRAWSFYVRGFRGRLFLRVDACRAFPSRWERS